MDTTPIIKRRKLNSAVNKPFKSPLKTSLTQNTSPRVSSPLTSVPAKDTVDDPGASPIAGPSRTPIPQPTGLKRTSHSGLRNSITSQVSLSSDPVTAHEIQNTTRAIRTLELNLMKTRQEIDTLSQAIRLATSDRDVELDTLTIKWRSAARQAAEEVFPGARDKVNRMGGVGAWRERQMEAAQFNDWVEPKKNNDEEFYDENGDLIEVERPEREENYEDEWEYDAERRKEEKRDEARDDDSFTMDMMLKMLNIDLQVIGYDKKLQRWAG